MEDLAVEIGLSCHLSMLYQSKVMVIVQARSHTPISLNITEGAIFPTRTTAAGKVLLANSKPIVRDMILKRDQGFIKLSSMEKDAYLAMLSKVSEEGFISESSQITQGVVDFSTLVGYSEGKVVASLSVSSLNTQLGARFDKIKVREKVMNTAKLITEQLGC